MPSVSLRARFVVPIDAPPIDGGVVTIEGERIVDVATRAPAGANLRDLGDVALLPGFVNTHTHLEFSDLTRPLGTPGTPLVDWIRLVIARRAHGSRGTQAAIVSGMRESLRYGVTTVCDISTADLSVYPESPQGPAVLSLLEVIGFSRARAASTLEATTGRLDLCRNRAADAPEGRRTFGLSPHAPYTVGPQLLQELIQLARRECLPVEMHVAESRDELELLQTGSGPFRELLEERSMWDDHAIPRQTRPFEYVQQLCAAPRSLVIHGTYLTKDELALLAKHRRTATLVYCPRTHSFFNRGRYPLAAALRHGVRVALGTDSRASSPDLSMLGEIRHAAGEHGEIPPSNLLSMATLDAAEALGIDQDVGSITTGKLANLTAVPIEAGGKASAVEAVVAGSQQPSATWYRGDECQMSKSGHITEPAGYTRAAPAAFRWG